MTTGLADVLPDVPGLAERWGKDVLHCPYCHGWEVRDQAIGVLATSAMALHQVLLFRQLSDDVTLFLHTAPEPTEEQWEELAARGISVVQGKVEQLEVEDDKLTGVRLEGGKVIPRQALAVQTTMRARADFLADLGLETVVREANGVVIGTVVPVDAEGRDRGARRLRGRQRDRSDGPGDVVRGRRPDDGRRDQLRPDHRRDASGGSSAE